MQFTEDPDIQQQFLAAFLAEAEAYFDGLHQQYGKLFHVERVEESMQLFARDELQGNEPLLVAAYDVPEDSADTQEHVLFEVLVLPFGVHFHLMGLNSLTYGFEPQHTLEHAVQQLRFMVDALLSGQLFFQLTNGPKGVLASELILQVGAAEYVVLATRGKFPVTQTGRRSTVAVLRNGTPAQVQPVPSPFFASERRKDGSFRSYGRPIEAIPARALTRRQYVTILERFENEEIAGHGYKRTIFSALYLRWEVWAMVLVVMPVAWWNIFVGVVLAAILAQLVVKPAIVRNKRNGDKVQARVQRMMDGIQFTAIFFGLLVPTLFLQDSIFKGSGQATSMYQAAAQHAIAWVPVGATIGVAVLLFLLGQARLLWLQFLLIAVAISANVLVSDQLFDMVTPSAPPQRTLSETLVGISLLGCGASLFLQMMVAIHRRQVKKHA